MKVQCDVCGERVEKDEAVRAWVNRPDGTSRPVWLCRFCAEVELEDEEKGEDVT